MFIGIDLGGSGTRAALAGVDGTILATGQGGPSGAQGGAAGRRHIQRALAAALAPIAPQVGSEDVCRVHVGLRGLSIAGRQEAVVVDLATRLPNAHVNVTNDALIALWGGLAGGDGVAVLAGTGSIALARSSDRREARIGGYGYLVGDEGGGYWLGREAVTACLRALDRRGPPTLLQELVCEATGQHTPQAVLGWLYGGSGQVPRLAALAPLVTRAAERGDHVALGALERAAEALAELAIAAARQLWPVRVPNPVPVACCGGVWSAGALLGQPFVARVTKALPEAQVTEPRLPAVGGAILLAMGAGETRIANQVIERLEAKLR